MTARLRVVDSGLRSARENLAMTEALCQRRRANLSPDTLRFQHFSPSAIIGRHQHLASEVNLEWVHAQGVETARRMTGGGGIVMGPGILGWELIVSLALVPKTLAEVSAVLCTGIAKGLSALGIDAAFRPRNDIEVAGRKISGTGGYFDGPCLVFQGTVLMVLDYELLTKALHLPAHKLGKRGLDTLAGRVCDIQSLLDPMPGIALVETVLAEGLANALGVEFEWGALTPEEEREAKSLYAQTLGTDAFVTGTYEAFARSGTIHQISHITSGGMIDVALKMRDGAAGLIEQILISGDFFVSPPRIIADLEAHLRHMPVKNIEAAAAAFLRAGEAAFLGMNADDICLALKETTLLADQGAP